MIVKQYNREDHFDIWNKMVLNGTKNTNFFFHRNYLQYHSDRFKDYSLIIFDAKGNPIALLPLNLLNETHVASHSGLTFGGLIVAKDVKLMTVIAAFHAALRYLKELGIHTLDFKQIPSFYNESPTDELDYLMFLLNANLYRRDVAFVVDLHNRVPYTGNIRREGNKAEKLGAYIKEDALNVFWNGLLIPNLQERFGVKPVHSVEEIELLQQRFPDNIKQYTVYIEDRPTAGVCMYLTAGVAHCQYIASNEEGRKAGSLNFLFKELIDKTFADKRYFDFGIVNENNGRDINTGMLFWKEGFGGRAHKHDFYRIDTANFTLLEKYLN